jgi:hypothetical protein
MGGNRDPVLAKPYKQDALHAAVQELLTER